MKFTIEKRNLFTVPKDYFLCHCISADFALGAGIAKKFAEIGVKDALIKKYGRYRFYSDVSASCFDTSSTDWKGEYNLVTKEKYWDKPTYYALKNALADMKGYCQAGDKIAMPKIGCGLDRLNWQEVEQIIKEVFADTDVEILVCDWR